MVKRYYFLILVIIMAATWVYPAQAALPGYELAAENEYLQLYVNGETAEIATFDKRNHVFWYSNPPNRATEETIAKGSTLHRLGAQIFMTYFTQSGAEVTIDNYNESVVYNQMEMSPIEQGIRFDFTLGQEWHLDSYVPGVMTKERFEKVILGRVADPEDREFLLKQYSLIWFEEAPEGYSRVKVTQIDKEKLLGNMTLMSTPDKLQRTNAKRDLYNTLFDRIVGREDISRRSQVTPEIMRVFMQQPIYTLGTRVSKWDNERIARILQENGFSPADREEDLRFFGYAEILPNHRVFRISIEYRLDGEHLVVRVPLEDISYPIDAVDPTDPEAPPVTLPVYAITVLPYFGAAGQSQSGYILVPDGCGALIYLNNGKTVNPAITVNIYGRDNSIKRSEEMRFLYQANLPVFGVNQGEHGFLAVIEKGDAVARVKADVAGRAHSYNIVASEFVVMPKGTARLQTTDVFTREVIIAVPQSRPIAGDLQLRYSFLAGQDATYVGMAHHYQRYLQRQGMRPSLSLEHIPFYLELIGAIQVRRPILGIPQTILRPLTTCQEAQEIVEQLLAAGIDNIHLRYTGWMKGGVDHDFPTSVKWEAAIGGQQEFRDLARDLGELGVKLFPDVAFLTVAKNGLLDGFLTPRDAGRSLDRSMAKLYRYDRATHQKVETRARYILSPKWLDTVVEGFLADYANLGIQGLSLRDLAGQLNSDFRDNPARLIDRQQAKAVVLRQYDKLGDYELMLEGGVGYALPWAEHVLGVPMDSNGYPLVDETVPFYQMVIRGFADYAGEPLNMAQDMDYALLRTIETGASPYYLWSYVPSSQVKHTDYDYLYAIGYENWLKDAVEFYRRADAILRDVHGQRIVGHEILAEGFHKTTYENGTQILVNYNPVPMEYVGTWVEGKGYAMLEGGR